jgi:potassium uptake TrkH family protein
MWSLISVFTVLYEFGFKQNPELHLMVRKSYLFTLLVGCIAIVFRYLIPSIRPKLKVLPFDLSLLAFYISTFLANKGLVDHVEWFIMLFKHRILIYGGVFLVFIREFSALRYKIKKQYLNPAQLFVVSFVLIILVGSLLLMLPNATRTEISYIDALFTSTSAVCVTGLVVFDTGSFFTKFGQVIILALIQAGGLGIMTFASYFSYFFQGGASYENQLMLRDMTNSDKVSEVFSVLKRIILVTLGIEAMGAAVVFFTLQHSPIHGFSEKLFFSIFHSVSAFCNAGFSTLPNNLYQEGFAFNYPLQLIIAFLFILGGIGFPIVFNLYKYIRYLIFQKFLQLSGKKGLVYLPWIINVNSRIVLMTTFILLVVGVSLFILFEHDNVLKHHNGLGKLIVAFFNAATPRTAGFNSVDFNHLEFSTIMLIFLLMWIGASPASTGGGIKTSTIAIATLNFFSLARGKDRIEVYNREIPYISIRRAFAIISLSLIVIGASIFLLAYFDREKDLLHIAFECFSAYSTVGLSLGVTPHLSATGKVVIIVVMLVGRVGTLTFLIALLRKIKYQNYKYPAEEILIN